MLSRNTVPPTSNGEVSFTSKGKSHGGYGGTLQFTAGAVAFFTRNVALTDPQVAVALTPPSLARKSNIVLASSTVTPGGELRTHS